jgi:hypothetical protein
MYQVFHPPKRGLALLGLATLRARCTGGRRTLELALRLWLVHLLAHLLLAHLLLAHLLLAHLLTHLLLVHLLAHLLRVHLLAHGVLLLVGTAGRAESAVLLRRLLRLRAGLAKVGEAHIFGDRVDWKEDRSELLHGKKSVGADDWWW